MTPRRVGRTVFFEPWSLGDVVIAAAVLRELTTPVVLACRSSWHTILNAACGAGFLTLFAVDLPYTTRKRTGAFEVSAASASTMNGVDLVLSIRGDLRDYFAAKKLFPAARIKMNGWARFLGRKSALVNVPYALGLLPVHNRYRSWATLSGIPYEQITFSYQRRQGDAPRNSRVVIHVGAQWRSKQYPQAGELYSRLQQHGYSVTLAAGTTDLLPRDVAETDVVRLVDEQLVDLLRSAEHVITNDSGPMHLAAFLGCRTTAVIRASPIQEWLPPATSIVASPRTPRGYRPHRRYQTDETLSDWPEVGQIIASLERNQNVAK